MVLIICLLLILNGLNVSYPVDQLNVAESFGLPNSSETKYDTQDPIPNNPSVYIDLSI